ncbi:MAG: GDSL-type esterase/lipase family protein, partial [Candidatus Hydrogenedentes bacterium]|nr:GDSL-type esterase/lipase family protein [Candidatus Hydrogenedentota bacterium]
MIWTLLCLAAVTGTPANDSAGWVTYTPTVTPDRAGPPWRTHREGGALEEDVLRLNPRGGYYIDDQPQFYDGSRNTIVEARLRVLERDKDAPGNHSAAEIWMGGPQPNTTCVLYIREDAASFNPNYQPAVKLDATTMHTYRIWRDVPNKKAYLFLDDTEAPVLVSELEAPHGYNINRILFGDSGGAADVSGASEWAFVRWGYISTSLITQKDHVSSKVTLVAFGDSTTAPRGPLEVYPRLLEAKLNNIGIPAQMVNAGVPGDTTALARQRFEKDVLTHKPHLAIISFGINDAAIDVWKDATTPRVPLEEYEANLHHFIKELREIGSKIVFFTPNPLAWTPVLKNRYGKPPYDPETNAGFNFMFERYVDAMRRV